MMAMPVPAQSTSIPSVTAPTAQRYVLRVDRDMPVLTGYGPAAGPVHTLMATRVSKNDEPKQLTDLSNKDAKLLLQAIE